MVKITASMAGTVWKMHVKPGDEVAQGQEVAILESMKMEIPIEAPASGKVTQVFKGPGDFVDADEPIIELEA